MRYLLGLFLLFVSFGALAVEYRCDNCSEAQYAAKATQTLTPLGENYVYDLVKGNSRKYQTYSVTSYDCPDGRYRCPGKAARPLAVESDVSLVVSDLTVYFMARAQAGGWFTFNADGDIADLTVFDVASPGGPQTRVMNWVLAAPSVRNALPVTGASLHSVIAAAVNIFKNNVGLTRIVIVLKDGGQIAVNYDPVNNTVEVDQSSIVDKFGNVVPGTRDEVNGLRFDYSRNPGGLEERAMKGYLSGAYMGASVPSAPKWACVSAGGGAPVCTPIF